MTFIINSVLHQYSLAATDLPLLLQYWRSTEFIMNVVTIRICTNGLARAYNAPGFFIFIFFIGEGKKWRNLL